MSPSSRYEILDAGAARRLVAVVMTILAAQRQRRRISQSEVARRMGVQPAAVSRWESGRRDLQLSTALRYVSTFADVHALGRACRRAVHQLEVPDVRQ